MTDQDFQSEQLDLTRQQIRLLALKPASTSCDAIECDLNVFDVENAPYYITLSYIWGSSLPVREILVNGKRFVVRQNLYEFLRAYRNDNSNVYYIWNDQICISQAHTGERNHQVGMMSQIYSRCLNVIIWLGFDPEVVALWIACESKPDLVNAIFERIYFTRLWVVQEILLSPEVRILCGDTWLSRDVLRHALNFRRKVSPSHVLRFRRATNFKNAIDLFRSRTSVGFATVEGQARMTLVRCLALFARQDCDDPRDKVYGLLGLVTEGTRPEVDYEKTIYEVFVDILRTMEPADWCTNGWGTQNFDIIRDLTHISEHMGLQKHRAAVRALLQDLEHIYSQLPTISGNVTEVDDPITALGFEPGSPTGQLDGWWYEHAGQRHSYYCDSFRSGGAHVPLTFPPNVSRLPSTALPVPS